jgi:hypothetical protein
MTTSTTTEQSGIRRALSSVAIVGVLATLAGLAFGGGRVAMGVGLGAAVACANLWFINLVVRGLLNREKTATPWGLIAVVKFIVLIGGLYLLVRSGWVDVLTLLIGYGALPLGIVTAQLGAARALGEEG